MAFKLEKKSVVAESVNINQMNEALAKILRQQELALVKLEQLEKQLRQVLEDVSLRPTKAEVKSFLSQMPPIGGVKEEVKGSPSPSVSDGDVNAQAKAWIKKAEVKEVLIPLLESYLSSGPIHTGKAEFASAISAIARDKFDARRMLPGIAKERIMSALWDNRPNAPKTTPAMVQKSVLEPLERKWAKKYGDGTLESESLIKGFLNEVREEIKENGELDKTGKLPQETVEGITNYLKEKISAKIGSDPLLTEFIGNCTCQLLIKR